LDHLLDVKYVICARLIAIAEAAYQPGPREFLAVTEAANKQIRLASRPSGWVDEQNFAVTEAAIAKPGDGEVLVHNVFMSVDPYMRGRMNDVKSYIPPFQIGEVLQAGVVGQVVESHFDGIAEGDFVMGMLGWENYSVSDGRLLRKIPPAPMKKSHC
jgi:hypothetical protein